MPRKNIDASVTDLAHAVGLLVRRVRATGTADRLSMTEAIVISRLAGEGPTTTAELARLEGMRPQSMRATVSALDKLGIVERKAQAIPRVPPEPRILRARRKRPSRCRHRV